MGIKRYALGNRWVEDKWKSNVGRITCVNLEILF